jgi:hypothetical protein
MTEEPIQIYKSDAWIKQQLKDMRQLKTGLMSTYGKGYLSCLEIICDRNTEPKDRRKEVSQ